MSASSVHISAIGVVLVFSNIGYAESYRCQSHLISEGDTALELKARCGTPDHMTVRTQLIATGFTGPQATLLVSPSRRNGRAVALTAPALRTVNYTREQVQTWVYLGDQTSFSRLIVIKRGNVTSIQSVGPLELNPDPHCVEGRFSPGTIDAVVEIVCGEPDDRSVWEEDFEVQVGGFLERRRIQRERWIYNPGPGRFLRLIEFANGKVRSVTTGGRAP
ncbi:MAG: DUF2845 domain-containing protein [Myxococcales bacterium]|nr:DUF2845 domain-containing protein [Myxococcales bacterium]